LHLAYKTDDWVSPEHNTGDEPHIVELFDLQNAPFEQFNSADKRPKIVNKLKQNCRLKMKKQNVLLGFKKGHHVIIFFNA
jgi:hypothetical protein